MTGGSGDVAVDTINSPSAEVEGGEICPDMSISNFGDIKFGTTRVGKIGVVSGTATTAGGET